MALAYALHINGLLDLHRRDHVGRCRWHVSLESTLLLCIKMNKQK